MWVTYCMSVVCSANNWWLRSANSATNFANVNNSGSNNNNNASNSNGAALGTSFARQSSHYCGEIRATERRSI